MERLTSEVAVSKDVPLPRSRPTNLADLMNPTDTDPTTALPDIRLQRVARDVIAKPEPLEKITPVAVQVLPMEEMPKPRMLEVKEPHVQTNETSKPIKLDLSVIADINTINSVLVESNPTSLPILGKSADARIVMAEVKREVELPPKRDLTEEMKFTTKDSTSTTTTNAKDMHHPETPRQMEEHKVEDRGDTSVIKVDEMHEEEEEDENSEETRCPCGSSENSGFMIACDDCNTWQHGKCMGFRRTTDVHDRYFCHICRPDQIRITCVAHPKYRERSTKDRDGKERRDIEAQLSNVKPVELRKMFISDMKSRKALLKTKEAVLQRYANLLRNQFSKYRQSVVEGLSVLLDLEKTEVVEKLEALRRQKSIALDDLEKKRSGVSSSHDVLPSEPGSAKSQGNGRGNSQKRARPTSMSLDAEYGNGRHEPSENLGEYDIGNDMPSNRGMSREERKIQQTMKLFARMEERQRERKKPRTGDHNGSPRSGLPSRPKTPKGSQARSQARSTSPKERARALLDAADAVRNSPTVRHSPTHNQLQQKPPLLPEQRPRPQPDSENAQQQGRHQSVKLAHPIPQRRSTLNTRGEGEPHREGGRKERDGRREKIETRAPKRKESSSPDTAGTGNGRRRSLLARERSHETKRRRVGSTRDVGRGNSKEQQKRDPSLNFNMVVVGPSVLGSKQVPGAHLSGIHREIATVEENQASADKKAKLNRKERLLAIPRRKERQNFLNAGMSPSPVKKRFRTTQSSSEPEYARKRQEGKALMLFENGNNGSNVKRQRDTSVGTHSAEDSPKKVSSLDECKNISPISDSTDAPTLSVSMVVVSEKSSLPDKGRILESTRLILPRKASTKSENGSNTALKKRAGMFVKTQETTPAKPERLKTPMASKTADVTALPETPCTRQPPPISPVAPQSPSPSVVRACSPRLRSSPVRLMRSPILRSVPAPSISQAAKDPAPLPSFRSVKPSVSTQRDWSFSPIEKKKTRPGSPETPNDEMRDPTKVLAPLSGTTMKAEPVTAEKKYVLQAPCDDRQGAGEKPSSTVVSRSAAENRSPVAKKETSLMSTTALPAPVSSPIPRSVLPSVPLAIPAVPLIRSIRSVPLPTARSNAVSPRAVAESKDVKTNAQPKVSSPLMSTNRSSGPTVSDLFQQRLQGFLKPAAIKPLATSPSAVPSAPIPSSKASSPMPLPRNNMNKRILGSPVPSVRGSTAKLSAALPLSSKPNLDSLRNSNGLSPRVGGNGMGYVRGSGLGFRSKPSEGDRPWNAMPSFSSVRRQHTFASSRGPPRGGSLHNGKNSNFGGSDKGRFGHGRDMPSQGRDGGHHGWEDDKGKHGVQSPQPWNRSYMHRNGWANGGNNGHPAHGEGGMRNNRRGHHAN